jgi:uncharacterized membrane protein (DUF373 family)
MIQVSYISTATSPMSTADLSRLLEECREYNAAHGVTGMLLYSNETFIQVLEGEDRVIDELLDRIEEDARHTDIKLLSRRRIEKREYSGWSMSFKRLADRDLRGIKELPEFNAGDFNLDYLSGHAGVVQSLMAHFRKENTRKMGQEELSLQESDPLIQLSHRVIRAAVRVLAVLMVFTILWGVIDVVYVIYTEVLQPSLEDYRARDIIVTFGAFLTVLIAIEIFINITLYLRDDVIHIRLVISTALMAIARKVIILDFEKVEPEYMVATAAVVIALGITYWLVGEKTLFGKAKVGLTSRSA